jgi:hypothetical protein
MLTRANPLSLGFISAEDMDPQRHSPSYVGAGMLKNQGLELKVYIGMYKRGKNGLL